MLSVMTVIRSRGGWELCDSNTEDQNFFEGAVLAPAEINYHPPFQGMKPFQTLLAQLRHFFSVKDGNRKTKQDRTGKHKEMEMPVRLKVLCVPTWEGSQC